LIARHTRRPFAACTGGRTDVCGPEHSFFYWYEYVHLRVSWPRMASGYIIYNYEYFYLWHQSRRKLSGYVFLTILCSQGEWQDLHDGNKTCMQLSYWELILENGQWLWCWITDGLCALPVTGWTGIHGFGYFSPLIRIAPFSAHKLIRQDTAVLHQAIIV
jgi:hypothetical protein